MQTFTSTIAGLTALKPRCNTATSSNYSETGENRHRSAVLIILRGDMR